MMERIPLILVAHILYVFACLSKNLGINMPVIAFYVVSPLNSRAGLPLEFVISQEHTCMTRQNPQVHLPKLFPALPLHVCFSEAFHQA